MAQLEADHMYRYMYMYMYMVHGSWYMYMYMVHVQVLVHVHVHVHLQVHVHATCTDAQQCLHLSLVHVCRSRPSGSLALAAAPKWDACVNQGPHFSLCEQM